MICLYILVKDKHENSLFPYTHGKIKRNYDKIVCSKQFSLDMLLKAVVKILLWDSLEQEIYDSLSNEMFSETSRDLISCDSS